MGRRFLNMSLLFFMGSFLGACYKHPIVKPDFSYAKLPEGLEGPAPEIREDYALDIDEERIHLTREYLRLHHRGLYHRRVQEDIPEAITFMPRVVVVHYTVIPTLEEVMETLSPKRINGKRETVAANGALNVGVQFVVDRDGTIYRLYPETIMARHVIGLNHVSIGIENVGDGDLDSDSSLPLTQAQLDANARLIRHLAGKYQSLDYMIGHMEYRDVENHAHPANHLFREDNIHYRTSKQDPGPEFMAALRRQLFQWAPY